MDEGYGQFCTVARGAEIVCERWTPLVVRELLAGSRRFNDIKRGVPRMSTSLLAQRLRHLEDMGIVRREPAGKVWEYALTEAGEELRPIVFALGHWGARWVTSSLPDDHLDAGLLLWDIRRCLDPRKFPPEPVILQIRFDDGRVGERVWWLIVENGTVDLCRDDPGRDPGVVIESTVRALTEVWAGDRTPEDVIGSRELRVHGLGRDASRVWDWLGTNAFAPGRREAIARRSPSRG